MPPNPYDPIQLVEYLDQNRADSTKLIWTLNLDLTPIYAVEAEPAYAEEVYQVLRSALRNQSLPSGDPSYVSRISIPGVLTGRTRRLFSGQVVPVVVAQARGLYTWNETALVQEIVNAVAGTLPHSRYSKRSATTSTRSTTSSATSGRAPRTGLSTTLRQMRSFSPKGWRKG